MVPSRVRVAAPPLSRYNHQEATGLFRGGTSKNYAVRYTLLRRTSGPAFGSRFSFVSNEGLLNNIGGDSRRLRNRSTVFFNAISGPWTFLVREPNLDRYDIYNAKGICRLVCGS